jgi:excisionase family DNA binding protein
MNYRVSRPQLSDCPPTSADATTGKPFFEKLVKKTELAELTGYSVSFIDKMMRKGLPKVKVGRSVRFQFSDVVAWLKRRSTS